MNRRIVLRTASYTILFVCFTALFLVINYPPDRLTDQVNGWATSISEGVLAVEDVRFKLPVALKAGKVLVRSETGEELDLGTAVVKPRFLGLFKGEKGADVRLLNPWLDSDFTIVSSGESRALDVEFAWIELSELPEGMINLPVLLQGSVKIILNLALTDPSGNVLDGDVNVESESIEIGGDILQTLGIAPLSLSRFLATATIKDNVLTLGENALEGDLNAVARGTIKLVPAQFLNSRLDLAVEFKPGPEKRERLMPVFSLLGASVRADGSINVRVRGTLGKPSITM